MVPKEGKEQDTVDVGPERRDGLGLTVLYPELYPASSLMDISNNRLMHAGRLAPVVTVSVANSPDTGVLSHQHDLAISIVSTLAEQMGWRIFHGRQTGVQCSGKTGVDSAMQPRAAKNPAVHCFTNAQHLRTYESEGRRLHLLGPTVLTRPGTEPLTPTHGNNPWWDRTGLSKLFSFNQRITPATGYHFNLRVPVKVSSYPSHQEHNPATSP